MDNDVVDSRGFSGADPTHASGVSSTAPLAPGAHRVTYTYALPLRNRVSTILLPRVLDTAVLDVLILDVLIEETQLEAMSDLSFGDRVSFESQTFVHFRGTALAAPSRSWVQLLRRTETAPLLRIAAYGLVICLVCLGLVAPFYERWQHRGRPETPRPRPSARLQKLSTRKQRLLQRIVRLEEQHAAGTIAEGEYQQQRQAAKTRLLALEQQLRR